ncbi:MAG: hypothetical protein GXY38_14155 [Planctomycetes bacterium]|nr:hypothetical protein [Planctomycetota bacterium]
MGDQDFCFVVAADAHQGYHKNAKVAKAEFARTIRQINAFDPAFVVMCGDMISSAPVHKTDEQVLAMWDEFDEQVKMLKAPLKLVPGNHDINTFAGETQSSTLDIYAERYGQTYYSFDHEQCHFIVLNAEVIKDGDKTVSLGGALSDEELAWLEADLEKNHDAKHTFVFVHRPSWQTTQTSAKVLKHWQEKVEPLLARYKVAAVFAGHLHRYCNYGQRDGVQYYGLANCGGGKVGGTIPKGTNLSDHDLEEIGGFRHFMLVEVRDNGWTCKVAKRDGLHPDTIVTVEQITNRIMAIKKSQEKPTASPK